MTAPGSRAVKNTPASAHSDIEWVPEARSGSESTTTPRSSPTGTTQAAEFQPSRTPPSGKSTATRRRQEPKGGRLACDICRERKVRCDRHWPSCGRCARLGDKCSYKGRARYRQSQAYLPHQIQELQNRLAQAEAKLSSNPTPTPGLDYETASLESTSLSDSANEHGLGLPAVTGPSPKTIGSSCAPTPLQAALDTMPTSNAPHNYVLEGLPDTMLDFGQPEFDWNAVLNRQDMDDLQSVNKSSTETRVNSLSTAASADQFRRASLLFSDNPFGIGGDAGATLAEDWNLAEARTSTCRSMSPPADTQRSLSDSLFPDISSKAPVSTLDLQILHENYFKVFYPTMPILCKERFYNKITHNQGTPDVLALSHAVALIGTMASPSFRRFQIPCLSMVRSCIELCERDEEMPMMLSLELFQTLLFLSRFELTHRTILRAWITIGRAVRLATILGLHCADLDSSSSQASGVHRRLPPTMDPICLEERRRSVWTLYVSETYASSRAGLPPLLQDEEITVQLPSPGVLEPGFVAAHTPTLAELENHQHGEEPTFSCFAGIVLACAIARRSQPHADVSATIESPSPGTGSQAFQETLPLMMKGFWDQHFALLALLKTRIELLAPHLTVRAVQTDPVAFALYVYLSGIDITLHQTALKQVEKQELSPEMAADSLKRTREAAYRIVGVARALSMNRGNFTQPNYFTLHGPFLARPVVTAIQVLGRDLLQPPEDQAVSTVAESLHVLLAALNSIESKDGFWHASVSSNAKTLQEWEEEHANRPADTWAASWVRPKYPSFQSPKRADDRCSIIEA